MKNHQGLSGKMFSTLGKTMSISELPKVLERNISAVINQRDVKKALNTLHERFFEDNTKQLNLFVMGVGNVGEKFIAQINQKEIPEGNPKMNLRVIALSNSKNDF
jgi:aspartokinase/homoserine dehydrogenase 1